MNTNINSSAVVNTVKGFLKANEGDGATQNIILVLGAEILGVTPEELLSEIESKKKKYKIPVYWTMTSTMTIEADSLEEAIDIAREDDGPIPEDGNFLDGSWDVENDLSILTDVYNNPPDNEEVSECKF